MPKQETEFLKLAYRCYHYLMATMAKKEIATDLFFEEHFQKTVVQDAIAQHKNHISVHHVQQNSIDVYKLTCWLGCYLLEHYKNNTQAGEHDLSRSISLAIVNVLAEYLKQDIGILLSTESFKFIVDLLHNEYKGNVQHGIWMNGLYLCFHVAKESHNKKNLPNA